MLNDARPIVPPMKNVVGNTHAETRQEIEARERARRAAEAAALAAKEQKANKKSPVATVLAIIFGFLALCAGGFAIYEYTENDKLKTELTKTQSSYTEAQITIESLEEENAKLKALNESLKAQLEPKEEPEDKESDKPEESNDDQPRSTPPRE